MTTSLIVYPSVPDLGAKFTVTYRCGAILLLWAGKMTLAEYRLYF